MTQLNSSYDIQRPSGQCASTGKMIAPCEMYFVALIDPPLDAHDTTPQGDKSEAGKTESTKSKKPAAEEPQWVRVDVSEAAWASGYRPANLFGYWRSEMPEPNAKKKLLVGNAAIQELMMSLAETTDDKKLAFRYVLALILLRKKLLRHDDIDRKECEEGDGPVEDWWQFTPKLDIEKGHFGKWNPTAAFEVLDPHLEGSDIQGVTEQLGQVLDLDL